jgi:hypothetical protein
MTILTTKKTKVTRFDKTPFSPACFGVVYYSFTGGSVNPVFFVIFPFESLRAPRGLKGHSRGW